jgi:hypothetical protein
MRISLAAIVASVAVVTGGLAWMRYLRGGLLADAVMAVAFVPVIAGENIFALVLPTLLNHEVPVTSALWTSVGLELLSSALLFVAALAGGTVATRRQAALLLTGVAVAIAAVASTAIGLGSRLALPIDQQRRSAEAVLLPRACVGHRARAPRVGAPGDRSRRAGRAPPFGPRSARRRRAKSSRSSRPSSSKCRVTCIRRSPGFAPLRSGACTSRGVRSPR